MSVRRILHQSERRSKGHEYDPWNERRRGVTCPSLRCPPCVFGVGRRETEAALRTRPSRSVAKRCGNEKTLDNDDHETVCEPVRLRVTMFRPPRPLPLALLALILYVADTRQQQLNLDAISKFSSASTLTLPSHDGDIAISVALCGNPQGTTPRVIFTNSSTETPTDVNIGSQDVFEILIEEGVGNWAGSISQGGRLAITDTGQTQYEVGISTDAEEALHQYLGPSQLLFGDSTGNQAIFFSPPFENLESTLPTYPNYTLPSAQTPFSVSQPSSTTQFTLTLVETSSTSGLLRRSSCALKATSSVGTIKNQTNWIRDETEGWRSKWLVEGLTPGTNYSVFVSQDGIRVRGPLYFTTKSGRCTSRSQPQYFPSSHVRKMDSFVQLSLS